MFLHTNTGFISPEICDSPNCGAEAHWDWGPIRENGYVYCGKCRPEKAKKAEKKFHELRDFPKTITIEKQLCDMIGEAKQKWLGKGFKNTEKINRFLKHFFGREDIQDFFDIESIQKLLPKGTTLDLFIYSDQLGYVYDFIDYYKDWTLATTGFMPTKEQAMLCALINGWKFLAHELDKE